MKKSVVCLGLLSLSLLSTALTAHADLGDSYQTSCNRYGGPGQANREARTIVWLSNHWIVSEQFNKNQCVAIWYQREIADQPLALGEGSVWQLLASNGSRAQAWQEYRDNTAEHRTFVSSDEKLYGCILINKYGEVLRVAYKSWLVRNRLLRSNVADKAPVEERAEPSAPKSRVALPPVQEFDI